MAVDVALADRLLTTTRSVRKRLDLLRPVEPAVIERAIEVALQTTVLTRAATSSPSPRSGCRAARKLLMDCGTIDQAKAEGSPTRS